MDSSRQILARFVQPEGLQRERFDRVALSCFPQLATRAAARKAIKRGEVTLNGTTAEASRWIVGGEELLLLESSQPIPPIYRVELAIHHEDDAVAIVEKPPGLRINGYVLRTLERALPGVLSPSTRPDALRRPRPCHRLDAPTGGLVVCAKTGGALAAVCRSFEVRQVTKRYRAIAIGRLEGEGQVTTPIEGRDADTRWRAIGHSRSLRSSWLTMLDLWPHTGRTHQLRRHLSELGHPILGDRLYGLDGLILSGKGLFLWAVEIALPHPDGGELHLKIEPPTKFDTTIAREQRRWDKWHPADGESPGDPPESTVE